MALVNTDKVFTELNNIAKGIFASELDGLQQLVLDDLYFCWDNYKNNGSLSFGEYINLVAACNGGQPLRPALAANSLRILMAMYNEELAVEMRTSVFKGITKILEAMTMENYKDTFSILYFKYPEILRPYFQVLHNIQPKDKGFITVGASH